MEPATPQNTTCAAPCVETIPVGLLQANAYLIAAGRDAVLIDPGAEPDRILAEVEASAVRVHAVVLTHAHYDHIGAVDDIRAALGCPVCIHEAEREFLAAPELNLSAFVGEPHALGEPDRVFRHGDTLAFGALRLSVRHTPGHSPGGSALLVEGHPICFSGDALFAGSIGRSDLPGGSYQQLIAALRERLLTLPDDTRVYPGHGPATTIGQERRANPYLTV